MGGSLDDGSSGTGASGAILRLSVGSDDDCDGAAGVFFAAADVAGLIFDDFEVPATGRFFSAIIRMVDSSGLW